MTKQSTVKTFLGLKSVLKQAVNYSNYYIVLGSDISITEDIIIPKNIIFVFDKYALTANNNSLKVIFDAAIKADLREIFKGFNPGQIIGDLGGLDRHPEWWGVSAQNAETAINCAIQARNINNSGHKIVLQALQYNVSAPIDLSGSNCKLEGKGPSRTIIYATENWSAYWRDDSLYGENSHGALIWLGSAVRDTIQSMNTSVSNVMINCYHASLNNLTKRVSGISSYGWMEEHTVVENVTVSYFSGYGIGMCSDGNPVQVINGLTIRNFWITGPVMADALPVAFGRHTTTATLSSGTIDCGVTPGSTFGGKPWPLINAAIWAEGARTILSDVHIESVKIGVLIRDYGQINSININGIDCRMGWEDGMTSAFDEPTIKYNQKLPENKDYFKHSALIAIYGAPEYTPEGIFKGDVMNYRTRIVANNLVASSRVRYLVRDPIMGQDILNWNNGQSSESFGSLTSYVRSNAWSPKYNAWYYNVPGCGVGVFPNDKTYLSVVE